MPMPKELERGFSYRYEAANSSRASSVAFNKMVAVTMLVTIQKQVDTVIGLS